MRGHVKPRFHCTTLDSIVFPFSVLGCLRCTVYIKYLHTARSNSARNTVHCSPYAYPPFPQGKQRKSRIQLLQLGILVPVPNTTLSPSLPPPMFMTPRDVSHIKRIIVSREEIYHVPCAMYNEVGSFMKTSRDKQHGRRPAGSTTRGLRGTCYALLVWSGQLCLSHSR
jgi:hypothetical protein